jgi:hypothetical protein
MTADKGKESGKQIEISMHIQGSKESIVVYTAQCLHI